MIRSREVAVLGALATLWACGGSEIPDSGLSAPFEGDAGPAALVAIAGAEVVGYDGPEEESFEVHLRTPAMTQFPCVSCHEGPVTPGDRGTEEHANVQPVHPSELAESCDACHDVADPARFALQNGESASLDEAYRLCAQCHYSQADAWAGGAHGKRLVAWRGRRVVMSCTECHDPHAPAFDTRIPLPGPNIPRTGGQR